MMSQSPRQIIGDAGVEAGVRTLQDVDDPLHVCDVTVSSFAVYCFCGDPSITIPLSRQNSYHLLNLSQEPVRH